jgi:hypothetical protein
MPFNPYGALGFTNMGPTSAPNNNASGGAPGVSAPVPPPAQPTINRGQPTGFQGLGKPAGPPANPLSPFGQPQPPTQQAPPPAQPPPPPQHPGQAQPVLGQPPGMNANQLYYQNVVNKLFGQFNQ